MTARALSCAGHFSSGPGQLSVTLVALSPGLFLVGAFLSELFPIICVDRTASSCLFYADTFEKIVLGLDARLHHWIPQRLSS